MLNGIRGHKLQSLKFSILLRRQQFKICNNLVVTVTDYSRIFAIWAQPGTFDLGKPAASHKNW